MAQSTEERDRQAREAVVGLDGWEGWYDRGASSSTPFHARIAGATPPVVVHGEDPRDLRDEVIKVITWGAEEQRIDG